MDLRANIVNIMLSFSSLSFSLSPSFFLPLFRSISVIKAVRY